MNTNIQHRKIKLNFLKVCIFLLVFLLPDLTHAQQVNKIQAVINSIKESYDNQNNDYITDGQRVVWVKSYKDWMPSDLAIMKKEDLSTLRFLTMAAQNTRYDVLEQLLPDYYGKRGGAKAFAADILRQKVNVQNTAAKKTR